MELSNAVERRPDAKIKQVVETMGNVALPPDFWDDFNSEVGGTDELHQNHNLLEKLTQFQHHAEHKRTSKLVRSYKNYNSLISLEVHDQGLNAFTCWAFSAASMIRNSCRIMIEDLKQKGLLLGLKTSNDRNVYDSCKEFINDSSFHVHTRNAILMILLPRQLHVDDQTQAAFLRAAVSRLANETVIDREGVFYLQKVTDLVCDEYDGLGFGYFPVNVVYKTYYNSHHPDHTTNLSPLIEEAVSKKLCPVAAHGTHAMVLDTIKEGKFVFKNTDVENRQVEVPVDKGPLEFYFVHIELNEQSIEGRGIRKSASLYFQHHEKQKRANKLIESYKNYNSMIILEMHDQGSNAQTCWAFSAASMIRNSCRIMIEDLNSRLLFGLKTSNNMDVYDSCKMLFNDSSFHVETRNAILMNSVLRQLLVDDDTQAASLRSAVSRLANETIIDRQGEFCLQKVTSLVCDKYEGLDLEDFPVNVTYKTYYNSHHPDYKINLSPLIEEAVAKKLCPVAAVDVATIPDEPVGHGTFVLVLDTIRRNKLIFKNTYAENKQVEVSIDKGPLEFYFVHMDLTEEGLRELRRREDRHFRNRF